VIVRRMAPADVEGVARLEQESPSPWSLAQIAAELAWSGSVALIAENSEGGLCGWCCVRYLGEEAELLKIAVRTESRRMGAGSALLVSLQKELGLHGVREIFLEVRRQN